MLFEEILNSKYNSLLPLFDELFYLVLKKQTHSGDLLLVLEHAVLNEERDPDNPEEVKLYYNIGTGIDYHCESTNYRFIGEYIKGLSDINYEEYVKLHEYKSERAAEINRLSDEEAISIQIEMLIYLKIWEGDIFLKKWYQLTRLATGDDYDWHCKINTDHSKKGKRPFGVKEKSELLHIIKKNLESTIPLLHEIFLKAHRPQLRNAIAHSQYAMLGRNIWLHNNNQKKAGYVGGISFDEWIDIFHETIVVFTLYNRFFDNVKEHYYQLTKPVRLKKEVRVQRLHPVARSYPIVLYSREYFKDWSPYPNP